MLTHFNRRGRVQHLQIDNQKQNQLPVCKDMHDNTKDRNFLSKVIIGDGSWVYEGPDKGAKIREYRGDAGQVAGNAGDYHNVEVPAVGAGPGV